MAGRSLPGRVLWCGSGGLASALAGRSAVPTPELPRPVLALIGSQHPNSIAQLSAAWAHVYRITSGNAEEAAPLARRLARANVAVAVVVPPGSARRAASAHIASCLMSLLSKLDRPGTMFVTGGETLRSVCEGLGARCLEVDGQIVPGVPTSVLKGGRWAGLRIVSKSGAFGDPGFLARLLAPREGGASMTDTCPRLALTMGDPAGIGPEIIAKACDRLEPRIASGELRVLVIGHTSAMRAASRALGMPEIPAAERSDFVPAARLSCGR